MLSARAWQKKAKIVVICCFFVIASGLNAGCEPVFSPEAAQAANFSVDRVAFLPVKDMSRVHGIGKSVISPLSGVYFVTGEVAEGAGETLSSAVVAHLKEGPKIVRFTSRQAHDALAAVPAGNGDNPSERMRLAAVGRSLRADAVLVGYVYKFRQRVGNRQSVSTPAALAFELHLLRAVDGRTIWSGSHSETQQSLSENLFKIKTFIERKGGWITVEELAEEALQKMLKDFPAQ